MLDKTTPPSSHPKASRRKKFDRESDGSVRLRLRFDPEAADNIEAAVANQGMSLLTWVHGVLAYQAMQPSDDLPWRPLTAERDSPNRRRVAELLQEGKAPSEVLNTMAAEGTAPGRSWGSQDRLIDALDNLIALGLLQSASVYLAVPQEHRGKVEAIAAAQGKVFAPGDRASLMSLVRRSTPEVHRLDVIATLRYGPIERNIGDLYMTIRSYELTLSGLIKGVLVEQFGLLEDAWWYEGVPEVTRVNMAAARERQRADDRWQLATFGDFQSIIKGKDVTFREAFKVGSLAEFKSDVAQVAMVRNLVMHPSKGIEIDQPSFQAVFEAFQRLRQWSDKAFSAGALDATWMPSDQELFLPPAVINVDQVDLDYDEGKSRKDGVLDSELFYRPE
jgi:hypothetical protein